jgi:hypothetical protein
VSVPAADTVATPATLDAPSPVKEPEELADDVAELVADTFASRFPAAVTDVVPVAEAAPELNNPPCAETLAVPVAVPVPA